MTLPALSQRREAVVSDSENAETVYAESVLQKYTREFFEKKIADVSRSLPEGTWVQNLVVSPALFLSLINRKEVILPPHFEMWFSEKTSISQMEPMFRTRIEQSVSVIQRWIDDVNLIAEHNPENPLPYWFEAGGPDELLKRLGNGELINRNLGFFSDGLGYSLANKLRHLSFWRPAILTNYRERFHRKK